MELLEQTAVTERFQCNSDNRLTIIGTKKVVIVKALKPKFWMKVIHPFLSKLIKAKS